jgi:hypothetical protein
MTRNVPRTAGLIPDSLGWLLQNDHDVHTKLPSHCNFIGTDLLNLKVFIFLNFIKIYLI